MEHAYEREKLLVRIDALSREAESMRAHMVRKGRLSAEAVGKLSGPFSCSPDPTLPTCIFFLVAETPRRPSVLALKGPQARK